MNTPIVFLKPQYVAIKKLFYLTASYTNKCHEPAERRREACEDVCDVKAA